MRPACRSGEGCTVGTGIDHHCSGTSSRACPQDEACFRDSPCRRKSAFTRTGIQRSQTVGRRHRGAGGRPPFIGRDIRYNPQEGKKNNAPFSRTRPLALQHRSIQKVLPILTFFVFPDTFTSPIPDIFMQVLLTQTQHLYLSHISIFMILQEINFI